MAKSVPVGLTNLVYCEMLTDDPAGAGFTYGSPHRILGAITANFSPNASNDTLFADDGPYDTASTLGAMTLELNVADLPSEDRARLLGATYSDGVLINSANDIPPYVAVGMSIRKSNGANRLVWYLKGKFTAPDDNNQTKADSINWNTPTISGNFLKRDTDGAWRIAVDTDDAEVDAAVITNWFASPIVDTSPAIPAVFATPYTTTLSKAVTTEVELECAEAGATIEYKLSTELTWNTYSAAISTTTWTIGAVILNMRASKTGFAPTYSNMVYNVTA